MLLCVAGVQPKIITVPSSIGSKCSWSDDSFINDLLGFTCFAKQLIVIDDSEKEGQIFFFSYKTNTVTSHTSLASMSRTASHCEFRNKQGGLINWVELRKVKGREKVWNNCLGFSRDNPSGGGKKAGNSLDSNEIHPETWEDSQIYL